MSKEKIIVHIECPTGHLSHAVNVRRDKEPPAQLGGGLDEKKSYSVGLSRFQPDKVKTFEGREGGADGGFCGEMDLRVFEFVGEGVFRVNRD